MPTKKRFITVASIVLVSLLASVSMIFAYFAQKLSGWGHTITLSVTSFFFNGETFGETITSDELHLSRGEEAILPLQVRAAADKNDVVLGYNINISFDKDTGGNEIKGLAPAIECYMYEKDNYKFLGMLDELLAETVDEGGNVVTGYNISGYLPSKHSFEYYLKLIYSPAAGEEYEGTTFKMTATAELVNLSARNFDYAFAVDENSLISLLENENNKHKTIYLLNEILLKNDLVISHPMSIDLNGFAIKKDEEAGGNPRIVVDFDDADYNCGIYNNSPFVKPEPNPDSEEEVPDNFIGVPLLIDTVNGFYAVNCEFGAGGSFSVQSVSLDAAAQLVQERFDGYQNKTVKLGTELDLLFGFEYYITGQHLSVRADTKFITAIAANTVFNGLLLVSPDYYFAGQNIEVVYNSAITTAIETLLTIEGYDYQTAVVGGVLTIRGNSLKTVAEAFMEDIPDHIIGSLFMPARDVVSGAEISWYIPSEYHEFFDESGTFLRGGFENLSSWDDQVVPIGIKVSLNGEQYSFTTERTVSVLQSLTAKKRTELIYSNKQIVLQPDSENESSVQWLMNEKLVKLSGLKSMEIVGGLDQSVYVSYDNENVSDDGQYKYFTLTVDMPHSKEFVTIENVVIRFTYEVGGRELIYEITDKELTILGIYNEYEIDDSSAAIQAQFGDNNYVTGEGNIFRVWGNVKSGVMLEYYLDEGDPAEAYIAINNGVYTRINFTGYQAGDPLSNYLTVDFAHYVMVDIDGNPASSGGIYAPFKPSVRYNQNGELDENGEYVAIILFDGEDKELNYVSILDVIAAGVYKRESIITVLYEFVPSENVTVTIKAYIYELVTKDGKLNRGDKNYKRDADEQLSFYKFTLAIKGILHYGKEIADYNVYLALLNSYDGVDIAISNGYIERDEAIKAPINLTTVTVDGIEYSYINMSGKEIANLKGLEYFPELKGINLSNNRIINITQLAKLAKLEYLNLERNLISDINGLKYLDSLTYLNLRANNITSLADIRYLPNIVTLDIALNENITDFSYIGNYQNLRSLYVRQLGGLNTNTPDALYYFALISANNPDVSIYTISDTGAWDFGIDFRASAKAMSQLIMAAHVANVLYAPSKYVFEGNVYDLVWSSEGSKIQFTTVDGDAFDCIITAPIIQEKVKISLKVYYNGTLMTNISRTEMLTLLPSQMGGDAYIEYAEGVYGLASSIIPDLILREKLFTAFNTSDSSDPLDAIDIGGGVMVTPKNLLSYAEIGPATALNPIRIFNFDWRYAGIKSLEGIQYFNGRFTSPDGIMLNLVGNILDEYEQLKYLSGLDILYMGGQKYDFSLLVDYEVDEDTGLFIEANGGLTNLKDLYVYESYELAEFEVLKGLFALYLCNNKNVRIFINEQNAARDNYWKPLIDNLKEVSAQFPRIYSFKELGTKAILADGTSSVDSIVYELLKQTVSVSQISIISNYTPQYDQSTHNGGVYFSSLSTDGNFYLEYRILTGNDQAFYGNVTLMGSETPLTVVYTVQLAANNFRGIVLSDGAKAGMSLSDVFSGRSLRTAVMRELSTRLSSLTYSNGIYYVTEANLREWITGTLIIDNTYWEGETALAGLELTGITELRFLRDATFGNGASLINIETIMVTYGGMFNTITTMLPNLKTVKSGVNENDQSFANPRAYTIFGDFLKYTPNLETLSIFLTQTANKYNWDFLDDLKDLDYLKNLNLFETTLGFLKTSTVMSYIQAAYNNISEVAKSEKNFYIQRELYEGEQQENIYVIEAVSEYDEMTSSITDVGTLIGDAGVKNGSSSSTAQTAEFYYFNLKQEFVGGDKIYLPYSTFNSGFGATYANNGYFNRSFYIDWKFFGIFDVDIFDSLFKVVGATAQYTPGDYFVRLIPDGINTRALRYDGYIELTVKSSEFYCAIEGTIGTGAFVVQEFVDGNDYVLTTTSIGLELGTPYCYIYPVYIQGGTNPHIATYYKTVDDYDTITADYFAYGMLKDLNFRLIMFTCTLGANSSVGGLGLSYTGLQPNNIARIQFSLADTGVSAINHFGITTGTTLGKNVMGRTDNNAWQNFTKFIYTLEGIENFVKLSIFYHSSNLISKLPEMWMPPKGKYPTALTSVTLTSNMITNLGSFSECSNLVTLVIAANPLSDISGISGLDKLVTLHLFSSSTITTDALEVLWGNSKLTALHLYGCRNLTNNPRTLAIIDSMGSQLVNVHFLSTTATPRTSFTYFYNTVNTPGNAINNIIKDGGSISDTEVGGANFSFGNLVGSVNPHVKEQISYFANGSMIPFIVKDTVSSLEFHYDTRLTRTGAVDYNINGQQSTSFDPVFWAYCVSIRTSSDSSSVTVPNTILINNVNMGIKSLKGLQYISNLVKIDISGNPITELWTGDLLNLTEFGLQDAAVTTKQVYDALKGATSLKKLALGGTFGIDYLKTFQDGGSIASVVFPRLELIAVDVTVNIMGGMTGSLSWQNAYLELYKEVNAVNKAFSTYYLAKTSRKSIQSPYSVSGGSFAANLIRSSMFYTLTRALSMIDEFAWIETIASYITVANLKNGTYALSSIFTRSNGVLDHLMISGNQRSILTNLYSVAGTVSETKRKLYSKVTASNAFSINHEEILNSPNQTLEFYYPIALQYFEESQDVNYSYLYASNYIPDFNLLNGDGSNEEKGKFSLKLVYNPVDGLFYANGVPVLESYTNSYKTDSIVFRFQARSNFFYRASEVNGYTKNIQTITVTVTIENLIRDVEEDIVEDTNFYIEMDDGTIEKATDYFDSTAFMYFMYDRQITGTSTLLGITNGISGAITLNTPGFHDLGDGPVYLQNFISKSSRQALVTLQIGNLYNTNSNSLHVTQINISSLKGIELFPNITSLAIGVHASVGSLEPIRNLHLTSFEFYGTSTFNSVAPSAVTAYNRMDINDFSALIAGSKNSLTNFKFGHYFYTYALDLSFLMAFPNLSRVSILQITRTHTSGSINYFDTNMYDSTQVASFRYLENLLTRKGVTVEIDLDYGQMVLETLAADEVNAIETLTYLNGNEGFDYLDNYRLNIKNNASSVQYLPGLLNRGGKLFSIEWREGYGSAEITRFAPVIDDGKIILDEKFSSTGYNNVYQIVFRNGYNSDEGDVYAAGAVYELSKQELDKLIVESRFITRYANGEITVSVEVDFGDMRNMHGTTLLALLIAKIDTENSTFQRMVTITNW